MDLKQWHQLDLNLLRLFVVLGEEQNLSRAAERLHVTPSAVSHALKRLRSHFNDELFIRNGANMAPSPLCKRVLPAVEQHMQGLFNALKQASHFEPSQHALHLRIAMPDALEHLVLPKLIASLSEHAKQVRIDSVALRRNEVAAMLTSGDIEFALDIARPLGLPIVHQKVLSDCFVVVGWQQVSKHSLTIDSYLNQRHIAVSSRPKGATVEDIALRQAGLDRETVLRCQTYFAALALVEQGQGVLTLPKRLAHALTPNSSLSIDPLPIDLPSVDTHVYSHENQLKDPALKWVFEHVCQMF